MIRVPYVNAYAKGQLGEKSDIVAVRIVDLVNF